jgi:hypothetical protein
LISTTTRTAWGGAASTHHDTCQLLAVQRPLED